VQLSVRIRSFNALDLLASLFRLIGPLAWILFDRLAGRWLAHTDGVPVTVDDVGADWLTAALQPTAPGLRVTRVERMGGHSGTTTRERLRVVTDPAAASAGVPETLFLKITPPSLGTRFFTTLFELGTTEVEFYRCLGGSLPVKAPRVYCARRARHGGRFVLLLEDLEAAGCGFPSHESPMSLAAAHAVVMALARLHAAFWESPRFAGDLGWLRSASGGRNTALEWRIAARSNAPALAKFGDVVSAGVRENAHRIHEHRAQLEAHWAAGPQTLLHGDPHAGNLYFVGGEAGFFDWQVAQVGPGLRDFSYFLVNSVETSLRRAHERELVELYLATLSAGGADAPEFDTAWEEHRLFALYTWIAVSVTAAASRLQPRGVVRRAFERTGAALEDLASLEALEALVRR
jgi:aminoglycoside phosphotransferase (APT) family kinase protein